MFGKEDWLDALLEKEPGGEHEARCLHATASLVRGALNAGEVPESVQSQSRAAGLALLEAQYQPRQTASAPPPGWLSRAGSWLQAAFNLFRRR